MNEAHAFAPPVHPSTDICVWLDVADLGASCAFYQRVLGFEVVQTVRAGLIFECRGLRSASWPNLELRLRAAFGRRPIGSPGGMLALGLRTRNLPELVERLRDTVRWTAGSPARPFTGDRAEFIDPDGYVIELLG